MKTPADDFQLVRAFQQGDEKAFEQLIRRYQRQVANLIYLTLGNRQEVEDLSQEVFIRVHRSLARFEQDASFYSWLHRITVNLCIDEIRRRKIKRTFSLETITEPALHGEQKPTRGAAASDGVLDGEKREVILKALQKLSAVHRTAVVLREYEDLSYDEIAKVLDISTQAVKSRIFRAREELRGLLKEYFKERS